MTEGTRRLVIWYHQGESNAFNFFTTREPLEKIPAMIRNDVGQRCEQMIAAEELHVEVYTLAPDGYSIVLNMRTLYEMKNSGVKGNGG